MLLLHRQGLRAGCSGRWELSGTEPAAASGHVMRAAFCWRAKYKVVVVAVAVAGVATAAASAAAAAVASGAWAGGAGGPLQAMHRGVTGHARVRTLCGK